MYTTRGKVVERIFRVRQKTTDGTVYLLTPSIIHK